MNVTFTSRITACEVNTPMLLHHNTSGPDEQTSFSLVTQVKNALARVANNTPLNAIHDNKSLHLTTHISHDDEKDMHSLKPNMQDN